MLTNILNDFAFYRRVLLAILGVATRMMLHLIKKNISVHKCKITARIQTLWKPRTLKKLKIMLQTPAFCKHPLVLSFYKMKASLDRCWEIRIHDVSNEL